MNASKLFNEILLTPRQVSPINIEFQQFKFVELLVNYKISKQSSYDAISYFDKFYAYLLSKEPNPRIPEILLNLAVLAKEIVLTYYTKRITITGDMFFQRIVIIYDFFRGLPVNPVSEIINKTNEYRNDHLK